MELKTILITQARTGSSRLPGKVLKKVNNEELLKIHLKRLSKCRRVDQIMVATTEEPDDLKIANLVEEWDFKFFRGSETDVLDRFYKAVNSTEEKFHWVVRVTSDCPLLDPKLVDEVVYFAQQENVDYVSNTFFDEYPDGQDVEVFKYTALEKAWKEANLQSEREHVTPFIRNNSNVKGGSLFTAKSFSGKEDFSKIRMTVDEEKDFELISKVIQNMGVNKDWLTYTHYIIDHDLYKINRDIQRNEGYIKSLKKDKNE